MAESKPYKPTEQDKAFAGEAKNRGCPYQAKYILMFGVDALEPNLVRLGITPENEKWYKIWVEEGHPWDWYYEYPEGTVF